MDSDRRQSSERGGKFLSRHGLGFRHGFAGEQLSGHAGYGNGGLAAKRLKRRAIDHFTAILFLELDPHAQHIATIGAPDRANGVGILHFTHVLRILDGLGDFRFQVAAHDAFSN